MEIEKRSQAVLIPASVAHFPPTFVASRREAKIIKMEVEFLCFFLALALALARSYPEV